MLFKELISILKKVKKPQDVTPEISDNLVNAAIASLCAQVSSKIPEEEYELDPAADLKVARSIIMDHFDNLIYDAIEEDLDDFDPDLLDQLLNDKKA